MEVIADDEILLRHIPVGNLWQAAGPRITSANFQLPADGCARQCGAGDFGVKKKTKQCKDGDIRAEYDASLLRAGVRDKYAKRYHEGATFVCLDAAFKQMAADQSREMEALDWIE